MLSLHKVRLVTGESLLWSDRARSGYGIGSHGGDGPARRVGARRDVGLLLPPALSSIRLQDPVADLLRGRFEQVRRIAPSANQVDHLAPNLRRPVPTSMQHQEHLLRTPEDPATADRLRGEPTWMPRMRQMGGAPARPIALYFWHGKMHRCYCFAATRLQNTSLNLVLTTVAELVLLRIVLNPGGCSAKAPEEVECAGLGLRWA